MPDPVLEQLGGVATETPPATDGLGSQAAPPSEETPAPAAEKPPESDTPSEAAAPSETETPVSTEEKPELPSWAAFKTTEEVLTHEDFAVGLKEREDTGYERGRAENRRLQGYLHTQQNTLKSIDEKASVFAAGWKELIAESKSDQNGVNMEQLRTIRAESKDMFESLSGFHQEAAKWDGIGSVVAGIAEATDSEELGKEFGERVGQVRTGVLEEDASFYSDLTTEIAKAKVKPLQDELVEAKAKIGRLESELKTAVRQEAEPPPETPSGAGDAKGGESAILSSSTANAGEKAEAYKRKYGFDLPGGLTRK